MAVGRSERSQDISADTDAQWLGSANRMGPNLLNASCCADSHLIPRVVHLLHTYSDMCARSGDMCPWETCAYTDKDRDRDRETLKDTETEKEAEPTYFKALKIIFQNLQFTCFQTE